MEGTKQYSIGNENSYSLRIIFKFGAFVQLCHLHISLIGQPGFVFFFWEIVFHSRQPLCVVYLSHKKGNLYFSDQKRVTLGPLFCGVVRPTDYSPVAIKFLQKNMITMMMMMIKTMMIT